MTNNKSIPVDANRSWGDVAVDGLWPGLVGGLFMIIYLLIVGLINGTEPLTVLSYFLPDSSLLPIAGLGTHLAASAVHGTIFGLLTAVIGKRRMNKIPMWLAGMLYALALWLVAVLVIVPSDLSGLGAISSAQLLLAHLCFGWGMGRWLAKSRP